MKKLASITITCVYLILSVGIAKSTHFCMGRALPASLFSFESKKCFCAELTTPDSCCDDKYELVKLENDQSASQVVHSPSPDYDFIGELFSEVATIFIPQAKIEFIADYNLPPPKVPIYKTSCSLIFYESTI